MVHSIAAIALLAAIVDVPLDIQPFVEKNTTVLAVERGDVNRDGREDAVLVLEPDDPDQARPLLILTGGANGTLKLAKRAPRAVLCRQCGGIMGDPFQGITIDKGRFTVEHYGGSSWRWTAHYTFAWSRRDRSWQLVRVESTSFHASDPEAEEKSVHTPPKDFGLIDVTEFDPENYLGIGKR